MVLYSLMVFSALTVSPNLAETGTRFLSGTRRSLHVFSNGNSHFMWRLKFSLRIERITLTMLVLLSLSLGKEKKENMEYVLSILLHCGPSWGCSLGQLSLAPQKLPQQCVPGFSDFKGVRIDHSVSDQYILPDLWLPLISGSCALGTRFREDTQSNTNLRFIYVYPICVRCDVGCWRNQKLSDPMKLEVTGSYKLSNMGVASIHNG